MMFTICIFVVISTLTGVNGNDVVNAVEVKTRSGWVRGYEEFYDGAQLFRFVKIPFAQPPVGKLRFHAPEPIGEWEDVQGISGKDIPGCPQWYSPYPGFDNTDTSEDCLYLNIYVPGVISEKRNLSVMVYIYGGGFTLGVSTHYRPHPLVTKGDVIVVTLNYRVGLLGFFTMNDPLLSGNYGLMDQIEALRWVKNNIAAFGGNPNSVTIFGESAGGMSVSFLTLMPSNEGLFQRAISQSGVASAVYVAKKEWEEQTKELVLERTNCKDKKDVAETVECLRALPADNITYAVTYEDIMVPLNVSYRAGGLYPSVDGKLIDEDLVHPKSPDDKAYKFFRSLDFMSGTLDGEGNSLFYSMTPDLQEKYNFDVSESIPRSILCEVSAPDFVNTVVGNVPELTQEICDLYSTTKSVDAQSNKVLEFCGDSFFVVPSNIMLSIHADNNNEENTFQFLITKAHPFPYTGESPSWIKGAGHSDDIRFFFDFSETIQHSEEELKGKKEELESDKEIADTIIQYWANFAKFGNPNGQNVPKWPLYDVSNKQYVIIDSTVKTAGNLKPEATALISKIFERGHRQLVRDEL